MGDFRTFDIVSAQRVDLTSLDLPKGERSVPPFLGIGSLTRFVLIASDAEEVHLLGAALWSMLCR